MTRYVAFLLCSLVVAASVLAAAQTITLKDGRKISGEVTKLTDGYEVKTPNGTIMIPLGDVASVADAGNDAALKEFQAKQAKIDKSDADAHVTLAEWAESHGLLEQAAAELKAALAIKPDHETAKLLLLRVDDAMKNGPAPSAETKPAPATDTASRVTTSGPTTGVAKDFISTEDVYRIRLAELKPDERVSVEFKNKVLYRYVEMQKSLDRYKGDPDRPKRFLARPSYEQVQEILHETEPTDTAIRNDIYVKDDPRFMQDFRKVWPIIEQNCAGATCHGADKGKGGLKLYTNPAGNRQLMEYTNFLILSSFEVNHRKLLERARPEKSLLLQYSLPVDGAELNHPKPIQAPFGNQHDPRYGRLKEWISSLKQPSQPPYNVTWTPPSFLKLNLSGEVDFLTDPGSKEPKTKPAEP